MIRAAWLFLAVNLIHTADHIRQGLDRVSTEVLTGGTILTLLAVLTVAVTLLGHERAAQMCVAVGVFAAVGIVAAHVPPGWGPLSDSYPDARVDALSWIVMFVEVAAAANLAAAGARSLQRRTPAVARA